MTSRKQGSAPHPDLQHQEPSGAEGCLWWRLFDTKQRDLQLWACLGSWRCIALRKRRRFHRLTPLESHELEFVESDLPLHAAIAFIDASDGKARRRCCEWLRILIELAPDAPFAQDSSRRIALHYALQRQGMDQDELCWLVAKSSKMLLAKDKEGQSIITHAVIHQCPDEIVVLVAVEIARAALSSLDGFVSGRHFESARRLCVRMVEEYFAGVPHFPHAFCLHLLRQSDPLTIIDGMQRVWQEFIDKWGYYGSPLLLEDLPPLRNASLDSFVQLTVKAKGEPLSYRWFCDGEPVPGATQPSVIISNCVQPHNEGVYQCEISNWKGRVLSCALQLVVVDDKHGPDPSLRFLLTDDEKSSLSVSDQPVRLTASRGGLVLAAVQDAATPRSWLYSCSLLIVPNSFQSFTGDGVDVSDSTGMEIVLRCIPQDSTLQLKRREQLVSPIVEVLPHSLPALYQPAIMSIPHTFHDQDTLHELVVIESTGASPYYSEVHPSRILEQRQRRVVSFELKQAGRYAVKTRPIASQNRDNEAALEAVIVHLFHPARMPSSSKSPVVLHLWIGLNRPDATNAIHQELRRLQALDAAAWTVSSCALQLRAGQLLHIRLGRRFEVSHMWQGIQSGVNHRLIERVRDTITLELHDLSSDGHQADDDAHATVFRVLEMDLAVYKPNAYQAIKRSSSKDTPAHGVLVSSTSWRVLFPVIHDAVVRPPQPSIHQRLAGQLALAYERPRPASRSVASNAMMAARSQDLLATLFEELHEMEREFTPYFYLVEMARFNETFWQRYDRTWWFDKTKSGVLLGMYKTVHAGVDAFTVIASDAYAGAIRVALCSIDSVSSFSEPFLLEPPTTTLPDTIDLNPNGDSVDGGEEGESSVPSGLRKKLTLPGSLDLSPQTYASVERLRVLLDSVYGSFRDFRGMFGIDAAASDSVCAYLERNRSTIRAANREVALLIVAMDRLERHILDRVYVGGTYFAAVWRSLGLLRRLVPELDCFPIEYSRVTIELHALMLELFQIVQPRSSKGWLAKLLLREWGQVECQALLSRVVRLLNNEAHALQGSDDLMVEIESAVNYIHTHNLGISAEQETLEQVRDYLLLTLGQPSLTTPRATVIEVASMLQRMLPLPLQIQTSVAFDDWHDLVANELYSEATRHAVAALQAQDTLAIHIRSTSPIHQELFAPHKLPPYVSIRFDIQVLHVDVQHVLKVTNMTLRCAVQGQTTYTKADKLLCFTPALPFEKHMRYQVKVRPQYVYTALRGGRLPLPASAASMAVEFATVLP